MSVTLRPMLASDLDRIEAQPAQARFAAWNGPDIADWAAQHFSVTAIEAETGRVLGCAGITPTEDDAGPLTAWAFLSAELLAFPALLLRAAKAGLDLFAGQELIAYVAADHAKAARFAQALNFTLVRTLAHPNGEALHLYARER